MAAGAPLGLKPGHTSSIRRIEGGHQARIEGSYPSEISGLTDNLNTLIQQERVRQGRYREALSFLAHSLKTPLAVLRSALGVPAELPVAVSEQVARMDDLVQHQLGRAVAGGAARFAPPLAVAPVLERIRDALAKVEAETGVPAEIIVSIIGVETSYGGNTGSYPVVDALYTLAFAYPRTGEAAKADRENRREAFFRGELAQLFALGQEQDLDITTLKGSYAGAMGWGQFMPSSYREFAVDGDDDGRIDLFGSTDDVFASIANYFVKKGGWVRGGPVVVRAQRDPDAQDLEPEGLEPDMRLAELGALGYRPATPVAPDQTAVLLNLDGVDGMEHWLGFRNFYAITRYNISKLYAMAVYQLAEAIAGRENPLAAGGDTGDQPGIRPAA
ncbi:MAG: lytic murein transglycosylase B [Proteobacteria bacterium]|nr:lytic murein transglycosylase B [Pseudomonadota bacterium]